jgi:hypothetical protein
MNISNKLKIIDYKSITYTNHETLADILKHRKQQIENKKTKQIL